MRYAAKGSLSFFLCVTMYKIGRIPAVLKITIQINHAK